MMFGAIVPEQNEAGAASWLFYKVAPGITIVEEILASKDPPPMLRSWTC